MDAKLTDQMERDLILREALDNSLEQVDAVLLFGTCIAIAMLFVGIILSTAA